ncbi:hypothetical protein L9F63_012212, partial [Diploptera punctata]
IRFLCSPRVHLCKLHVEKKQPQADEKKKNKKSPEAVNGKALAQSSEGSESAVAVTVKKCPGAEDTPPGPNNVGPAQEPLAPNKLRARRIDELSRLCFPLAFAVFNVFYWSYYLS